MSPQDRFLRELEHLRRDSNAATQFLYTWLAIHKYGGSGKNGERALNRSPLFWNTNLGALQTTLFITLGRIFDNNWNNHTIDRLLREARNNQQIFSRPSLAARKRAQSPGAAWVNQYVRNAYVPTNQDFQRLSGYVRRKRAVYKKTCGQIRQTVFAHNAVGSDQEVHNLFAKTRIDELQRLVLSLRAFHEAMWQLYFNGQKPTIRAGKYSVNSMEKDVSKIPSNAPIEQRVFAETYSALKLYAAGAGS